MWRGLLVVALVCLAPAAAYRSYGDDFEVFDEDDIEQ